jgi:hypothetical protein
LFLVVADETVVVFDITSLFLHFSLLLLSILIHIIKKVLERSYFFFLMEIVTYSTFEILGPLFAFDKPMEKHHLFASSSIISGYIRVCLKIARTISIP